MLINLSNHPSGMWKEEQLKAAVQYGEIIDISFPAISSSWSTECVWLLANDYCKRCLDMLEAHQSKMNAVHVAGELLFCYYIIQKLLSHNITVLTSASDRNVTIDKDIKRSEFHFVQFREFMNLV